MPVEGELVYEVSDDPAFMETHGMGPGCEGPEGTVALPPVRLLNFAHQVRLFNDPNAQVHSICADSFAPPLVELGERLREQSDHPPCYHGAPCDVDPDTPVIDVECELHGWAEDGGDLDILECARGEDGAYLVDLDTGRAAMPDAQSELCYLARIDTEGLTADPLDDAWQSCVEASGSSLGFEIVTPDGRAPDLWIDVTCQETA